MLESPFWINLAIAIGSIGVSIGAAIAVARYRIAELGRRMEALTEKTQHLEITSSKIEAIYLNKLLDYREAADNRYVSAAEFGKLLSGI